MNSIQLYPVPDVSPFDQIKQHDDRGAEFWSARDLMCLMGYTAWRNFETPLQRAMKSAEAQGHNVHIHFAGSRKNPGPHGGRPLEDFELSRFAAYLVAMNGDPNKPEVAAAQAYFAVRTREAETATPAPALSEEEIIQQALQITTRKVEELEARNAAIEPKAAAYDAFLDADGTYPLQHVAKMLGIGPLAIFQRLRDAGVLIATAGERYNTPYQAHMHHFTLRASEYTDREGNRRASYTTRVRPSGVDFIRRKLGITTPALEGATA